MMASRVEGNFLASGNLTTIPEASAFIFSKLISLYKGSASLRVRLMYVDVEVKMSVDS